MSSDASSAVPEYALVVTEKGGQERRQVYSAPELTVGRVAGNDVVLPTGNVSKRHARILYREGRFIVTDLNSTNGTYVNRRRIAQATIIREGDKVYVGDFVIRIEPLSGSERVQLSAPLHSEPMSEEPSSPSSAPEALGSFAAEPDLGTVSHSVLPGWERPAVSDDLARPSSGPPPARMSDPPGGSEGSSSQRVADMASGHRRAVGQVVEAVIGELGLPATNPDDVTARKVRELVLTQVDQLLVQGLVPSGSSSDAVAEQARDELLGLGPLAELLEDAAVSSVSAARFDELVGTRDGRQQEFPPGFSSARTFELALRRLCERVGIVLGADPVVETTLEAGVRLSIVRGTVAPDGPLLTLYKPRRVASSLDDLVRRGAVSRTMATFLGQCVSARLNILVVGPRDEGARSVLSALCGAATRERIISVSDFDDIAAGGEGAVRLDLGAYQGDARRLFDVASSIAHARLAVTLTKPEVTAAALEAVGAGTSGLLASLQASNLDRALLRLPADIAAARPGIGLEAATGYVLSGFDLAVEVARLRDGRVRVLRIAELARDATGGVECSDIFRFSVSRVAAGGAVEGTFSPSGRIPRLAAQLQAMGTRIETSLFSRPPSR